MNLFEKFKDKEDSNVKDSENKVFMREFLKKLKEKYNFMNKLYYLIIYKKYDIIICVNR